jgi:cytoskeletal protein CcmA (bactofilin family)
MKRPLLFGILLLLFLWPLVNGAALSFDAGNILVGDQVVVGPQETKEREFTVAGADVEFMGKAKKGLRAFGASVVHSGEVEGDMVVLSGTFDQDVAAGAARITVAPTAVIKGNLRYTAAAFDRMEGARIQGVVARREFREREEWVDKGKKALAGLWLAYWVLSIPALIIVGVLARYFFPRGTEDVLSCISQFPWKSIGVGLVFLVGLPVAAMIAMTTLVGIPAGVITLVIYALFLYISRVFAGVWIGRRILSIFKKSWAEAFLGPLILGILLTSILLAIPVVGWFFWLLFILLGVGAMWQAVWGENRGQRKASMPESAAASMESSVS